MERTLVILKPDTLKRQLMGQILERFEKNDLKIIAMKMVHADLETLKIHYPDTMIPVVGAKGLGEDVSEEDKIKQGTMIINGLREYMMSGPIIPMIIETEDAVKKVRTILGATDPAKSDKGTIRGDFGIDSIAKANSEGRSCQNLVHASGNVEEANQEINIWFSQEEILE